MILLLSKAKMLRSRRKRWVGHVSSFRGKIHEKLWMENLMEKGHLQDIDGKLVQKFVWS
jgi:hypothetical protein